MFECVKAVRVLLGCTQMEFAKLTGVSTPTVGKYESGGNINGDYLRKLAEAGINILYDGTNQLLTVDSVDTVRENLISNGRVDG